MSNRYINALIKTIIFLAIAHIVVIILGVFFGNAVGWFGIHMIWPHWNTMFSSIISIVLAIVIYIIAYLKFTGEDS